MKRFVTVFPLLQNQHLTKDLGQIPYFLHKKFGFESVVVSYENGSYEYREKEVKGLKIEFIKNRGRYFQFDIGVILYLFKNARRISVLNLYHFCSSTYVYGILFKILNFKGVVYLKSDMDFYFFRKNYPNIYNRNKLKNSVAHFFERIFLRIVDLISIENKAGYDLLKNIIPQKTKVIILPNGIDIDYFKNNGITVNKFDKKENIILTVGRIGLSVKNHKMLLNIASKINLENWKIIFVGAIDSAFQNEIISFFEHYPELKEKVVFTGEITSKEVLYNYYNKSKIFCLTSDREGTPIVFAESLYFGLYFLSTDCSVSLSQYCSENNIVDLVPVGDTDKMIGKIKYLIENENDNIIENQYIINIKSASDLFDWGKNIEVLGAELFKMI